MSQFHQIIKKGDNTMSNETVIRAWKDEAFRNSLSPAELAMLPPNPAGLVELSDADLGLVPGAVDPDSGCLCITTIITVITVSVSATASCTLC